MIPLAFSSDSSISFVPCRDRGSLLRRGVYDGASNLFSVVVVCKGESDKAFSGRDNRSFDWWFNWLSPFGQWFRQARRACNGYWLWRECAVFGQGPKGVAELLPFADLPWLLRQPSPVVMGMGRMSRWWLLSVERDRARARARARVRVRVSEWVSMREVVLFWYFYRLINQNYWENSKWYY